MLGVFVVVATGALRAGVVFCYSSCSRGRSTFLVDYDAELYDEQIRASYYLSFVTLTLLAFGLAFEMPIFILALVRLGVLTSDKLRRNRRIGYVLMVVFAILLPTVDPVSLVLEVVPLLVLFEASIWLVGDHGAPLGARRPTTRSSTAEALVRVVSADWVVPVEGDPIADGAVAIADDGTIAAVGPAAELGAGRALRGLRDPARASSTPTRTSSTPSTPGSATGCRSPPWIGMHVERKGRARARRHGRDRDRRCARVPPLRGSRRSATAASPARLPRRRPTTGLRAIVYLEVFGTDEPALERFDEIRERIAAVALRPRPCSASRRTRRTPARSSSTRPAPRSGFRMRRTSPRASPSATCSSTGAGDWAAFARHARAAARDDRDPHARGRRAARRRR